MQAACEECGEGFEAKRSTAKYCTTRCRTRATRRRAEGRPSPALERPAEPQPAAPDGREAPLLVAAVIDELTKANRLTTWLGLQAVELAERVAARSTSDAAAASLSKELRAIREDALAGAGGSGDPIDELRARRDRKRRAG